MRMCDTRSDNVTNKYEKVRIEDQYLSIENHYI